MLHVGHEQAAGASRRRRERLSEAAITLGWAADHTGDPQIRADLEHTAALRVGHVRETRFGARDAAPAVEDQRHAVRQPLGQRPHEQRLRRRRIGGETAVESRLHCVFVRSGDRPVGRGGAGLREDRDRRERQSSAFDSRASHEASFRLPGFVGRSDNE